MPTKEQTYENGRIVFYIIFVLLLIAGVFASGTIKKVLLDGLSSATPHSLSTARSSDDDDFDDDGSTSDRSMTG